MFNLVIRNDGEGQPRAHPEREKFPDQGQRQMMLYALSAVLFVVWCVGLWLPLIMGGLLHLILALAIILFVAGATHEYRAQHREGLPAETELPPAALVEGGLTESALASLMEQHLLEWGQRIEALETRVRAASVSSQRELGDELAELKKLGVIGHEYLLALHRALVQGGSSLSDATDRWTHLSTAANRVWSRVDDPHPVRR